MSARPHEKFKRMEANALLEQRRFDQRLISDSSFLPNLANQTSKTLHFMSITVDEIHSMSDESLLSSLQANGYSTQLIPSHKLWMTLLFEKFFHLHKAGYDARG
jgi:hypothetical protein